MFTKFSVENFKAFKKLTLNKLKRVNMITGVNSSGKTCLLESLFLFAGATNPKIYMGLCKWRGDEAIHPRVDYVFRYSFYDQKPSNTIKISAAGVFKKVKDVKLQQASNVLEIKPHLRGDIQGTTTTEENIIYGLDFYYTTIKRTIKSKIYWDEILSETGDKTQWRFNDTGKATADTVAGRFISPRQPDMLDETSKHLNEIIKKKKLNELVELMRCFEPDLVNITTINEEGRANIYADIGKDELFPLTSLGYGFFHFIRIALGALVIKDGILLIDEIENGIHHKVLPKLISFLFDIAEKNNLQVFFTTHSYEVVNETKDYVLSKKYDDFEIIRFFNKENEKVANIYDSSDLQDIDDVSLELR